MKRTASAFLLSTLVAFPVCAAQRDDLAKRGSAHPQKLSRKTVSISGTVGSEGKSLVSDRDNRIWKVVNPDVLYASEGRHVTVKGNGDANSSEIRVAVVRLRQERTTPKLDDAAFRR